MPYTTAPVATTLLSNLAQLLVWKQDAFAMLLKKIALHCSDDTGASNVPLISPVQLPKWHVHPYGLGLLPVVACVYLKLGSRGAKEILWAMKTARIEKQRKQHRVASHQFKEKTHRNRGGNIIGKIPH